MGDVERVEMRENDRVRGVCLCVIMSEAQVQSDISEGEEPERTAHYSLSSQDIGWCLHNGKQQGKTFEVRRFKLFGKIFIMRIRCCNTTFSYKHHFIFECLKNVKYLGGYHYVIGQCIVF